MNDSHPKYILTFDSVHFVMRAEKALNKGGIEVRLIPTPREISSDCGMALEITCEDIERTKELLKTHDCRLTGVYDLPQK
jgi:hypothetical protein